MRNRNLLTLLTLSLTIWAVGCEEEPTASIEVAKGRLAAVATKAATYAPDAYEIAEEVAARLDGELEIQAERFAVLRSYERTNELTISVETAAEAVESAIGVEKQRFRIETDRLVSDAEQRVSSASDSIAGIASEDLPEEQASAWGADLSVVETSLTETARLLAEDQLVVASHEASSALSSANEIKTAITAFVTELERLREEEVARRARGEIALRSAVLANGEELAAGTYLLSLAEDSPSPSGTGPSGRWVEFVDGDIIAGRGLAVVIADSEIGEVSDSGSLRNEARVAVLKEGDYVRVWLNRDGVNYLVHLPPANSRK